MDFVSGRGWNTSCQLLDEQERQELAAEIEWAYIRAPLEDIVMLETKPQELCSWQDLVAGTRFIVEHMLFAWLQRQNVEQGLAPSRSQLVEQALANIPTLTPEDVKSYLNTVLASSDRSQRRWLAKFRRRWGGSSRHFEALQHFAFEGEAEQGSERRPRTPKCRFVSISKGLFLGPPGGPKFRSVFFSYLCNI